MQKSDRVVISAVAGMGGIGKTELAIKYAREHDKDYAGGICWLTARDESLATNILLFAQLYLKLEVPQEFRGKPLTLKEQVDWCWQNWQPPEDSVLLVLDDVTSWKSCRDFIPKISRFRILITTRLRNLDSNFVELPLDVLSPDEALELLTALVGERRVHRELQTATELCKWLGYLPLGLELVGRYLVEDPDLSLAEMWERLKKKRLEDEAINPSDEQLKDTEMTAKRGVKAALELSWQELDLMAQNVGELLSLFAPDIIPWELVKSVTELLNWGESEVNEGKKQLYKRHLIKPLEEMVACYQIHPLIREFLQAKLAVSEQASNLKQAFVKVMVTIAKKIPESPNRELIESLKVKIPHLAVVAQNLTNFLSDEDLIWPFNGLGRFYEGQGLYTSAESWHQQCLAVVKAKLGDEHPDVASSLNNLAGLYDSQGHYQEAEPLYQEALDMIKRLLGEKHPHFAIILNNLAFLYKSQGGYQEAAPLLQEVLDMRKRLLGEEHPDVAYSLNNLAFLYKSQGGYQEAEPLFQEALGMRKRLLGEEHPLVAYSLNNLAFLYKSQGGYQEAEPLFQEALGMRKRLLGEEHPDVATSLNDLAGLYNSQGRYQEAEPLYLEALSMRKGILGEEHPDIATSLNDLAGLYKSQGRYQKAEPLYLEALSMRKGILGEEHPDVATSLNDLAGLYYSQERYQEAEPLYQKALDMRKRLLGEEHPDVATSLNDLALLYYSQGRYQEAEPLFLEALDMRKRLLGKKHPDIATSLNNLALTLQLSERVFGVNHPNTVTIRKNLTILQSQQHSSDEDDGEEKK